MNETLLSDTPASDSFNESGLDQLKITTSTQEKWLLSVTWTGLMKNMLFRHIHSILRVPVHPEHLGKHTRGHCAERV